MSWNAHDTTVRYASQTCANVCPPDSMAITRRMWNWLNDRLSNATDFDDTSYAFGYFADSKVIEQFRVTDTYVPHLFERATFYYHGHYFAMELDFTSTGFFRYRATLEMIF